MKYKLPSSTRRKLDAVRSESRVIIRDIPMYTAPEASFETPPSIEDYHDPYKIFLYLRNKKPYHVPSTTVECTCSKEYEYDKDGVFVCTLCGLCKDPVYDAPNSWDGTHTVLHKQFYDPCKYLDKHLQKCVSHVPHTTLRKIRAIFPKIFRTFFILVPHRKNFMSYGFVIRKLLDIMKVTYTDATVPTIKTACKIRQCQQWWDTIEASVDLYNLVPRD